MASAGASSGLRGPPGDEVISCPICFTVPADRILRGVTYVMCACSRLDVVLGLNDGHAHTRFIFHCGRDSRLILGQEALYRHGGGDWDWKRVPEEDREAEALKAAERARTLLASSVLES